MAVASDKKNQNKEVARGQFKTTPSGVTHYVRKSRHPIRIDWAEGGSGNNNSAHLPRQAESNCGIKVGGWADK